MNCCCPKCSNRVKQYGLPAYTLMSLCISNFFEGELVLYRDVLNLNSRYIRQTLRYLERKGYLLSCEMDQNIIGIIPNTILAVFVINNGSPGFCWCHLHEK